MSKKNNRITVEDLWKIKRPSSPVLSPDASQVCVALTQYDMEANKGATHLWLLSTFGGEARELTQCGEKDGQPQWSPDGSQIAFVAKRACNESTGKTADEEPQIYLIAPDGGEAKRLTNISTGASAIKWFADGKRIAFVSLVWPDLKSARDQATRLKMRKEDKVKAHVVEHSVFRHWDHWISDGRVPCVHVVDVKTGKCENVFAGTTYELPVFDTSAADYDIAPDGRHVAFCFNPNADKRGDQEQQIVEMDIKSRKVANLTASSAYSHFGPAYSPDGKTIAVLIANYRRSFDDDTKVARIDRKSGTLKQWSTWDRLVNAPLKWAADGGSVFFTADDRGRTSVWRLETGAKKPVNVAPGGSVGEFDIVAGTLVFVRNNMSSPPKVFAADADGGNARAIESFNDERMAKCKLGDVREFTIKGWNNEPVQMWVIYPPNFDARKKWPMVHNIHGGPHANWGDNFHFRWNNHVFAAAGYVVVCVNYHGSQGWGNKFTESNNGSWGTKEHADVEAGTEFMLKQGYVDAHRMAATGGSYGGKMVAWMNGRNGAKKGGDRYKAYVCHAGCFDWASINAGDAGYWLQHSLQATYWDDPVKLAAQNPATFAKHMKTPTLVIHGALDYRVPDAQGLMYYSTLKAMKVSARLVFFPDENHWIVKPQNSRLWYLEYFAWLKKYIGAGPTKKK